MGCLPLKDKQGYTLIEALVSLVMISLVTLGGLSFYRNGTKLQQVAMHKQVATEIANSKLEDIRTAGYASLPNPASNVVMENKNINTGSPKKYAAHFGSNTLQRSVTVDDVLNGSGGTDFKKVTVLVSWTEVDANSARNIEMTTYVTP